MDYSRLSLRSGEPRRWLWRWKKWGRRNACSMRFANQDRVIGPDVPPVCYAPNVQASGHFPQALSTGGDEKAEQPARAEHKVSVKNTSRVFLWLSPSRLFEFALTGTSRSCNACHAAASRQQSSTRRIRLSSHRWSSSRFSEGNRRSRLISVCRRASCCRSSCHRVWCRLKGFGARYEALGVSPRRTGSRPPRGTHRWHHSASLILVAVRTFLPPCSLTVPIAVVRIGTSFVAEQIPLSWWKSLATLFFAR